MPITRYSIEEGEGGLKAVEDPDGDWCATTEVLNLERDHTLAQSQIQSAVEALDKRDAAIKDRDNVINRLEETAAMTTTKLIAAEEAAAKASDDARHSQTRVNSIEASLKQVLAICRDAVPDDAAAKRERLQSALKAAVSEVETL